MALSQSNPKTPRLPRGMVGGGEGVARTERSAAGDVGFVTDSAGAEEVRRGRARVEEAAVGEGLGDSASITGRRICVAVVKTWGNTWSRKRSRSNVGVTSAKGCRLSDETKENKAMGVFNQRTCIIR